MKRADRRALERAKDRADARRKTFDQVHGEILRGKTVRDLWLVYANARFTQHGIDIEDPAFRATVEQPFYAGVLAMFELMQRVSPDDVNEEVGVEMLNRLQEELEAYSRRGTH